MDRPKPFEPAQAYEAIQRILEARDTIALTPHARQRMRDRNFTVDDVHHVLTTGTVSSRPEWNDLHQNWRYTVSGRGLDRVPLVLVVVLEPALGRITLITGKDD